MDEYEEFGDGGEAGGSGGEVRSLFGSVVARSTPVVGFTPDGIAAAGRSHQRRRRAGTVLGATASVAAVAFAVSAFAGGGTAGGNRTSISPLGPGDAAPAGPTTAPTTMPTPWPPGTSSPTPTRTQGPPSADELTSLATFKKLVKDLDPAGTHLAVQEQALLPGYASPVMASYETNVVAGWGYGALWTPEGKWPASPEDPTPYVNVRIDVDGPKVAIDQLGASSGQIKDGVAVKWGPKTVKTLADGSVVSTVSLTTEQGTSMAAERCWPDKRCLVVNLNDASATGIPGYPSVVKTPFKPFPFTEASLAQVLEDPELKVPSFK